MKRRAGQQDSPACSAVLCCVVLCWARPELPWEDRAREEGAEVILAGKNELAGQQLFGRGGQGWVDCELKLIHMLWISCQQLDPHKYEYRAEH